jgi:hypothetical protein
MPLWVLKGLVDSRTVNQTVVDQWYRSQSEDVQIAFVTRMKFLRGLPGDGWDRPYVGQLRRKECKGLYEIVISMPDIEHRPIGYFSGEMEFTIVAFATERDSKFEPKTICATAKRLIDRIKSGEETVRVFTFED